MTLVLFLHAIKHNYHYQMSLKVSVSVAAMGVLHVSTEGLFFLSCMVNMSVFSA